MKSPLPALCVVSLFCALPAQAQVAGFSDVPAKHWAAQSVQQLAKRGILAQPSATKPAPASKTKSASGPHFDGDKPVTRYEMAVTLYRFVQYIEHADAQRKTKTGADNLPTDGPTALKKLIAEGYLPANTPLAGDGAKPVTANQFADALAQVIAHSREKTTPVTPGIGGDEPKIEKPAPVKG